MPDGLPSLAEMVGRALARPTGTPAIEFEGQWITWGGLAAIADALSRALRAGGLASDAPVVLVARNRPASIAALLGLLREGRSVCMVYAFQSCEAIGEAIARIAPGAAVLDNGAVSEPVVAALRRDGILGIVLDDARVTPIPGTVQDRAGARPEPAPQDPVIEILTSGTTGPPKSFPIRQRMIAESFIGPAGFEAMVQNRDAAAAPALLYFPLGNITGIYSTIPPLVRGQRACLLDRFSLPAWHDYVVRHRPSRSGIPPAAMRELLDAAIPQADLASLEAMGMGAAPLDPDLHRAFEDRYGIPVLLSYGATEFAGPVCGWTLDLHAQWGRAKLGSVGRALPGAQLRVIDPETGAPCHADASGLLEVISPRIGPEWIRTADMARLDGDGFLWLLGRADGAIIRGGFKILPETVERALRDHPEVAEAVVVGLADSRLGQVPAAAVRLVRGSSTDPQALARWLRMRLLAPQVPTRWLFCEAFPLNPSLKIDRPAIRRLFDDTTRR